MLAVSPFRDGERVFLGRLAVVICFLYSPFIRKNKKIENIMVHFYCYAGLIECDLLLHRA